MKVFISWSGTVSEAVAIALRDWLPMVIQSIEPYVSSEDIEKGARWGSEISNELESSDFGILCITRSNTDAPWLNFEAGALSKSIERSRVVPFLFGLSRTDLPQGPLVQFQSVLAERDEVRRMLVALNTSSGEQALDEARLDDVFEVWWPRLEQTLLSIQAEPPTVGATRSDQEVLHEILDVVRGQQQILNEPEALLPRRYLRSVIRADVGRDLVSPKAVDDLGRAWERLGLVLSHEAPSNELIDAYQALSKPVEYLLRRFGVPHGASRSEQGLSSLADEAEAMRDRLDNDG